LNFYQKMSVKYGVADDANRMIAAAFPIHKPPINQHELAAWIMVGNALLNLDEAVSRE